MAEDKLSIGDDVSVSLSEETEAMLGVADEDEDEFDDESEEDFDEDDETDDFDEEVKSELEGEKY